MSARHLIVGMDGADLRVIEGLGRDALPNLFAAMNRGAFAALESVKPPATLPNWLTFLTAVDPGEHGVFDFTTRSGYQVAFRGGTARTAPLVAEDLDRAGLVTAWLSFPGTWPPPRLANGVFMSGWDSPVAFHADRSFVWPEPLYDDITKRFGAIAFGDVDEFLADQPGWHDALPASLCRRVERKTELAEWLLASRSWDVFAVYFGESDTAAHHLWSLHDPDSPRRPPGTPNASPSPLERVYLALDEALGALLRAAGDDVELTVVSDHGSGGSSDKVLYLNRALAEAGLLRFRQSQTRSRALSLAKGIALKRLPAALRERVFRAWDTELPSWLESRARFGAIDMGRTTAFSDELNYFPGVHLNLRGREPAGTISPADRTRALRDVAAALLALRDPWNGKPIVRAATPREELFEGPHVGRAPDLLLDLHRDGASDSALNANDGYSWNLMPSAGAPPGTGSTRRLGVDEYLGRKGRSMPGSHRDHGIFVAAGPRVKATGRVEATMHDAAVTTLARMDAAPPPEARGRVLWEALEERSAASGSQSNTRSPSPQRRPTPQLPSGNAGDVERRLRALGYIE